MALGLWKEYMETLIVSMANKALAQEDAASNRAFSGCSIRLIVQIESSCFLEDRCIIAPGARRIVYPEHPRAYTLFARER